MFVFLFSLTFEHLWYNSPMDNKDTIRDYIDSFIERFAKPSRIPFQKKILKTSLRCAGVSIPEIRYLSAELLKKFDDNDILSSLDLSSMDEQCIFLFIAERSYVERFTDLIDFLLDYADSWAIPDTAEFSYFIKEPQSCVKFCNFFLSQKNPLKRRLAFVFMIKYLTVEYSGYVVNKIKQFGTSEDYILQMAIAWTIQVLYLEKNEAVLDLMNDDKICPTIKRMAIQKLIDSHRVSEEDKEYFRSLRSSLKNKK